MNQQSKKCDHYCSTEYIKEKIKQAHKEFEKNPKKFRGITNKNMLNEKINKSKVIFKYLCKLNYCNPGCKGTKKKKKNGNVCPTCKNFNKLKKKGVLTFCDPKLA